MKRLLILLALPALPAAQNAFGIYIIRLATPQVSSTQPVTIVK